MATRSWCDDAVVYQIYPKSFRDGDGDGIGDLAGVLQGVDHLERLGIDAVWFSPFYPSGGGDGGYDVADYFDIDPVYGTLEDFDRVVAALRERGIRVIIDLVPNHTSWDHEWFRQALAAGPGSAERERFHFVQSGEEPPSNWAGRFGGIAWEPVRPHSGLEEDEGWWYLHLYDVSQPDLNWNHPDVSDMVDRFFRFWSEHGVEGFRIDVAHGLVKAEGYPDDHIGPHRWAKTQRARKAGGEGLSTLPYFDQDGVHEIYRHWRRVLDEIGGDRILVAEAWVDDPERLARYVRADEMNQAFNFRVLKCGWKADALAESIEQSLEFNDAVGASTTWVLSNHDVVRHVSRYGYPFGTDTGGGIGITDPQPDAEIGRRRGFALTSLLMGLPGSMYIYNGEELGLPEATTLPDEARVDPTWFRTEQSVRGRDGCRVPLPWSAEAPNFGFSDPSARTWLPMPAEWGGFSVSAEDAEAGSMLALYREVIALRRSFGLGAGSVEWIEAPTGLVALRNGPVAVVTNAGVGEREIPVAGRVVFSSIDGADGGDGSRPAHVVRPNETVWVQLS